MRAGRAVQATEALSGAVSRGGAGSRPLAGGPPARPRARHPAATDDPRSRGGEGGGSCAPSPMRRTRGRCRPAKPPTPMPPRRACGRCASPRSPPRSACAPWSRRRVGAPGRPASPNSGETLDEAERLECPPARPRRIRRDISPCQRRPWRARRVAGGARPGDVPPRGGERQDHLRKRARGERRRPASRGRRIPHFVAGWRAGPRRVRSARRPSRRRHRDRCGTLPSRRAGLWPLELRKLGVASVEEAKDGLRRRKEAELEATALARAIAALAPERHRGLRQAVESARAQISTPLDEAAAAMSGRGRRVEEARRAVESARAGERDAEAAIARSGRCARRPAGRHAELAGASASASPTPGRRHPRSRGAAPGGRR